MESGFLFHVFNLMDNQVHQPQKASGQHMYLTKLYKLYSVSCNQQCAGISHVFMEVFSATILG